MSDKIVCPTCGQKFNSEKDWVKHIIQQHPGT